MNKFLMTMIVFFLSCSVCFSAERITLQDGSGNELGTASNPIKVSGGGATLTDLDDLPGDTVDDDLIDQDLVAGLASTGSATPGFTAYDSGNPGTDKEIGKLYWNYIDGADGSENGDFYLQSMQDGAEVTVLQFDESDDQIEGNKPYYGRITPRVSSEASSATPTINTDNVDAHSITAIATDITSMTTNLSGTPTNFQKLIIRIKDDGTSRGITWGASFEAKGTALPTATTISKVLTVAFIYDTVTSKWGCVGSVEEE